MKSCIRKSCYLCALHSMMHSMFRKLGKSLWQETYPHQSCIAQILIGIWSNVKCWHCCIFVWFYYRPHSLTKQGDNALCSICPSICPSVHLSPLSRLNCLTYNLDIWYVNWPWLGWDRRSRLSNKVHIYCKEACECLGLIVDRPATQNLKFNKSANNMDNFPQNSLFGS